MSSSNDFYDSQGFNSISKNTIRRINILIEQRNPSRQNNNNTVRALRYKIVPLAYLSIDVIPHQTTSHQACVKIVRTVQQSNIDIPKAGKPHLIYKDESLFVCFFCLFLLFVLLLIECHTVGPRC